MSVGERLRAARTERKLSLKELGSAAKLSKGFISQVESGTSNPSLKTLRRLADALGVPVSSLLGEELTKKEQPGDTSNDASRSSPVTILQSSSGAALRPFELDKDQGRVLVVSLRRGEKLESSAQPNRDPNKGLLVVLFGTVRLSSGTTSAILTSGQVALFDLYAGYTIAPNSGEGAEVLLTLPKGMDVPARITGAMQAPRLLDVPLGQGPLRLVELRAVARSRNAAGSRRR